LAELAGHATPRRLQALLAEYVWDAQVLAERVRAFLVDALADPEAGTRRRHPRSGCSRSRRAPRMAGR
jgi:hypothetical protein